MSYCFKCDLVKEARVHHCRVCGKCIQRMDHHCPWVGNCVGKLNHKYFILFLFYATVHAPSCRYTPKHPGWTAHRGYLHHRRLALRRNISQQFEPTPISDLLLRLHHFLHAGFFDWFPLRDSNDDRSSKHHDSVELHGRDNQARNKNARQNVFERGSVTANLR